MEDAEVFLFAVPSQFYRSVLMSFQVFLPKKPVLICANKGIELESLMTMSQVTEDVLMTLKPKFAMISGPSFALEVARELPTAVALGCEDKKLCRELQEELSTDYFRVYTNPDVRGVELGGDTGQTGRDLARAGGPVALLLPRRSVSRGTSAHRDGGGPPTRAWQQG